MQRFTTIFLLFIAVVTNVWASDTEPAMPDFNIADNSMKFVSLDGDESLERNLPMRCGFYKSDGDMLKLYPAIGELYTYEEGPFYTDDLARTFFYEIFIPRELLGSEQTIGEASNISVRYYDILREEWLLAATSGTIKVVEKQNGTYAIELQALDSERNTATAMKFNTDEAWRWREYGEMRPNPNVHKLSWGGHDYEEHYLNSCVMDTSGEDFARLYFCTTPDVTTVEGMNQLPADDKSLVVIEITKERMNGNYLSFSMTRNVPSLILNIHYNGEVYSSSRNDIDGGNACIEYNASTKEIDVTSMLFTLPSPTFDGGHPNWKLVFNGTYSEEGAVGEPGSSMATAIELVEGENTIPSLKMGDATVWYKTTAKAQQRTKVTFTGYPVLNAYVGSDLAVKLGTENPVDYINDTEEDEDIFICMQSTNEVELTATVTYGSPVTDLVCFGALAYSIKNNENVAPGSNITVTFPEREGGDDNDEVTLSYYIFLMTNGNPDGAPINLGGITEATGTLGAGVPVTINGLELGKRYRLSIQSLHSDNHYAPSVDEQDITSNYINFYYTNASGIVAIEDDSTDAPAFNIAGQRVNNTANGIIIKNGKKYIK